MNTELGTPVNITASTVLKKLPGGVLGFYVNSTSSGTVALYDAATAVTSTPISGTITPAIGYHRFPAALVTGLYVVVGSTINVTFFVQ